MVLLDNHNSHLVGLESRRTEEVIADEDGDNTVINMEGGHDDDRIPELSPRRVDASEDGEDDDDDRHGDVGEEEEGDDNERPVPRGGLPPMP